MRVAVAVEYSLLVLMTGLVAKAAPQPCSELPEGHVLRTPIETAPLHPLSAQVMATLAGGRLHPDFGAGEWEGSPIGIPITFLEESSSTPSVPIVYTAYGDESDPGPAKIPLNAAIEGGGVQTSGDRHVLVWNKEDCELWELYRAFPKNGEWHADSGARFDLKTGALRPFEWTSADAAGLPIAPLLVQAQEVVDRGYIGHALRFTVPRTRGDVAEWPARHWASDLTSQSLPVMGMRLRLRADFDEAGFGPQTVVVLRALKKYGMILADHGSQGFITGEPSEKWDNDQIVNQLHDVPLDAFEVVDTSSWMVDFDSGIALVPDDNPTDDEDEDEDDESEGPCRTLPDRHILRTKIVKAPLHPLSERVMSTLSGGRLHPDFGAGLWEGSPIGIPITPVPSSTPLVPIAYTAYGDESDPGPAKIPLNALIEGGGVRTSGDRHVLAWNAAECELWELYRAFPAPNRNNPTSWEADSGARFDLKTGALRPYTWTSGDAAGLPIAPLLVRADEVVNKGRIAHAIRVVVDRTRGDATEWPARHWASDLTSTSLPVMGMRLRLRKSFRIDGFGPQTKVVLRALQEYGMIVADHGTEGFLGGEPSELWDNDQLVNELHKVPLDAFDVVDTSSWMVDESSGLASPPCTPKSKCKKRGVSNCLDGNDTDCKCRIKKKKKIRPNGNKKVIRKCVPP